MAKKPCQHLKIFFSFLFTNIFLFFFLQNFTSLSQHSSMDNPKLKSSLVSLFLVYLIPFSWFLYLKPTQADIRIACHIDSKMYDGTATRVIVLLHREHGCSKSKPKTLIPTLKLPLVDLDCDLGIYLRFCYYSCWRLVGGLKFELLLVAKYQVIELQLVCEGRMVVTWRVLDL